jgi:hypothetical protein
VGQDSRPALAQGGSQNSADDTVTVIGCPVQGVEAGCMVLTDKNGAVWEISSARPRPRVGYQVIKVTGRKSRALSTCMQGTRLESIQWTYTGEQCPETK